MRRTIICILLFVCFVNARAQTQTDQDTAEVLLALKSLALKPRSEAYARFIDIYLVASPHEDADVQRLLEKSRVGDRDAFSYVAFMVWKGYAGFRANQTVGKLALTSAFGEGSGSAAYFLGETLLHTPVQSDTDHVERYVEALRWYGLATGMGDTDSHDRAMAVVEALAPQNQDHRRALMSIYLKAQQQGAERKLQAPTE